ncbi:MAG: Holliday junction branch migration protein RuvA [Candidatus Magasanikbacteria bacterium]|nr:Holliday junction branch migration protein RuvA [Candidatus Magasanikbacteria bacterium]
MISFIKGRVLEREQNQLLVFTAGGLGYQVMVSHACSDIQVGQEIALHTFLKVSDHAMELFGFKTKEEQLFFCQLMTVSGIGPRSALNILSLGSLEQTKKAITKGDIAYLTAIQGMGKKTAERLVVELKSKIKNIHDVKESNSDAAALAEVVEGLVSLGYSRAEARDAVQSLDAGNKGSEEILKMALQKLSR